MSKSIKRVLAMLLSVCMVVGMMPTLAFAEDALESTNIADLTVGSASVSGTKTSSQTSNPDSGTEIPVSLNYTELETDSVKVKLKVADGDQVIWKAVTSQSTGFSDSDGGKKETAKNGVVEFSATGLNNGDNNLYLKVGKGDSSDAYYKITFKKTYTIKLGGTGVQWYNDADEPVNSIEVESSGSATVKLKAKEGYEELTEGIGLTVNKSSNNFTVGTPSASADKLSVSITPSSMSDNTSSISYNATRKSSEAKIKKVEITDPATSKDVTTDGGSVDNPAVISVDVPFDVSSYDKTVTLTLSEDATGAYIEKNAGEEAPGISDYTDNSSGNIITISGTADLSKVYYVRVTAEDKATVKFYKIEFKMADPKADAELSTLKITYNSDKTMDILSKVKGYDSFKGAESDNTEIEIPYNKTVAPSVNAITKSEGATLSFASGKIAGAGGISSGNRSNVTVPVRGLPSGKGEVWLKLVAENGTEEFYHFFVVMPQPRSDAALKSIKVAGYEGVIAAATSKKNGSTADKAIEITVDIANGIRSTLTNEKIEIKADAGAEISYGTSSSSVGTSFGTCDVNGACEKDGMSLNTGDLYIKVVAQDGETTLYYKVIFDESDFKIDTALPANSPKDGVSITDPNKKKTVETAVEGTWIADDSTDEVIRVLTEAVINDNLSYPTQKAAQNRIAAARGNGLAVSDPIYYFAVPYLDIKVASNGYDEDEGVYVLDITPKYYVVATTEESSAGNIKIDSETKTNINAVKISTEDKELALKNVKVEIKLPNEFVSGGDGFVYVKHESDNATYEEVTNDVVTVTAKSFSTYTITKAAPGEAMIGTTVYETLQDAIDAVGNGGTINLTEKAEGKDYSKLTPPTRKIDFTIDPGSNDVDVANIGFTSVTSGSYTYTAEIDKDGNVTVTRTGGSSDEPGPIEPSQTGDLEFEDPADLEALQDMSTTVGTDSAARFELNLKAIDGKDLEDSTKWDVKAADTKVIHVTAKNKLRFNKIGETTVTVKADSADGTESYEMTFDVNVTKLGVPVLTVKKGSKAKTFTVKTEKVYGASKIVVRYSKSASIPDNSGKKTYTSKLSSTKTIKVAKSKKTYYVKARAVSGDNKSEWSEVKSKKTK